MKMVKVGKGLLKVIVFTLLLALGFCYFSDVLLWKTSADINLYNGKHFYENEENTIDVLSFGNSHCFCTINNALLYEEYGIASYNFSAGAQQIGTTYYFMKESLEYQTPKVMLVELCTAIEYKMSQGDVYRNALALKPGENYYKNIEYIDSLTDGIAGDVTDLALQWPITHTRYAELEETDYNDYHYFQRGFRPSFVNNVYEMPEASREKGIAELEESVVFYLEQMIALAKEHEVELVFYVAPYMLKTSDQMIYNAIEKFVEEKDVTFFNFTTEENLAGINYATDVWNTGHLNIYGADKVTRYLGEYLKSAVALPDRRGDENYLLWEEDASYLKRLVQENSLKKNEEINVDDYFNSLKTLDNLCVITLDGDKNSYLAAEQRLKELGVSDELIQEQDVFVFCEGELATTMKKGDARYYEEYQKKSVVIKYQEETDSFAVNIGEPFEKIVKNGMNIYVYNEIDGTLVDIVGVSDKYGMTREPVKEESSEF